jgi:hypothetical protein
MMFSHTDLTGSRAPSSGIGAFSRATSCPVIGQRPVFRRRLTFDHRAITDSRKRPIYS